MRKLSLLPLGVLLLGIVGAILRHVELNTVFDPDTGLAETGAGISVALIGLTAAVFVLAIAVTVLAVRKFEVREQFRKAFYTRGYADFAVMALLGLAVILGAVLTAFNGQPLMGLTGMAWWVFVAFLALGGYGMSSMAYSAYTQRDNSFLRMGSVMPAILYCYWMVALYRINAGNPVLLEYCYGTMAFAAAAMSSYYTAGYAYGRKNLVGSVIAGFAAIFLLTVTLADSYAFSLKLVIGATAVYITQNTIHLLSALTPRRTESAGEEQIND